jgi:DNA-binding transcriptional ArsR family regulator
VPWIGWRPELGGQRHMNRNLERMSGGFMTESETRSRSSSAVATATAEEEPLITMVAASRWTDRARLLGIMAHPVRLAILEILCEKPRCVKHINALVPLAQSHLSQHLGALRKGNLVASLACGALRCYYVLQPTLVKRLIWLLRQEHPLQRRTCASMVSGLRSRQEELAEDVKVA